MSVLNNKKGFSTEFKVGIFTLIGIIFIVLLGAYFSKDVFSKQGKKYYVIFSFLNGLQQGAAVKYAGGLTVGKISTILPDNNKAKLAVLVDAKMNVTNKTSFSILSDGLLGEKYININLNNAKNDDGNPIKNLPEGSIIEGTEDMGLDKLMSSVTDLIEKTTKAMVPLSQIINKLSESGDIQRVITELKNTLHNAAALLGDNRTNVKALIANFNVIMQKINTGKGSLSKLINDRNMAESLSDILINLKVLTAKLSQSPLLGSGGQRRRNSMDTN